MTRPLQYAEPLMVKLEPELKERLKIEAARSRTTMSSMVRELLVSDLDRRDRERSRQEGRGARLIEHMRGRATGGMTTDEIMALTRGE
jgi:predicted transcriptional regulator